MIISKESYMCINERYRGNNNNGHDAYNQNINVCH